MARKAKDKPIWAENVYRDAFDRASVQMAIAGEHLKLGEYHRALPELDAAEAQLRSLRDLLGMREKGDGK